MILCDYFPLYDFVSCQCLIGTENNWRRSMLNESVTYGLESRSSPSTCEGILTFWMFTLLVEEIRQVRKRDVSLSLSKIFHLDSFD